MSRVALAGEARRDGADPAQSIGRIRDLYETELRAEAAEWERDGGVPRSVYERLAGIGLYSSRWPEGARHPGVVVVAETAVREMSIASVGGCVAAGTHMEAFFRALSRCEWGEQAWDDAIAGKLIGALAVTERTGGSNPTRCETVAERTDAGWVLNGHKHYCSNLRAATDLVVFTRTARGRDLSSFTLFVVPSDAEGVTLTQHEIVGARAAATGMIDFEGVEIGDERRVGNPGSGLIMLLELLRAERVLAAVAGISVAELTLEMALAFCGARTIAGGATMRQNQMIAQRLATIAAELDAARALVRTRLDEFQNGRLSSAGAAAAKLIANRVAWKSADEAMQLMAGRGFTEETPLAQIWRDIRIGRIGGGTDEVQLELIAQSLRNGELSNHPAVLAAARSAEA